MVGPCTRTGSAILLEIVLESSNHIKESIRERQSSSRCPVVDLNQRKESVSVAKHLKTFGWGIRRSSIGGQGGSHCLVLSDMSAFPTNAVISPAQELLVSKVGM